MTNSLCRTLSWVCAATSKPFKLRGCRSPHAHAILHTLKKLVQIHCGERYLGSSKNQVKTTQGNYDVGYVVNAAGLYADCIARDYGFSQHYRILPFKGLYLYSSEPSGSIRTNIYPVPDLENPFLGGTQSNGQKCVGLLHYIEGFNPRSYRFNSNCIFAAKQQSYAIFLI